MSKRLMFLVGLFAILLLVLGVAWFDGGREEQRLIVEPVELPERNL